MTLKEQQSKIFDDWGFPLVTDALGHKTRPGFRSDGVIDENTWDSQSAKVVFILKEPNGGSGSLAYSLGHLREQIESGRREGSINGKVNTWSNISCWLHALQDIINHPGNKVGYSATLRWKDYESQGRAYNLDKNLKRTVILNLKKSAGGARSKDSQIKKHFADNAELFKRQYDLYKPDIVVCCGPIVEKCIRDNGIIDSFDKAFSHYNSTEIGRIWYYAPPSGPVVIGFFHPQCSKSHAKMFDSLVRTAAIALSAG